MMNRARSVIAFCIFGLAIASGCKLATKCADPGDDPAGLDIPTTNRMKEEASKNPAFCSQLSAPHIALTSDAAVLGKFNKDIRLRARKKRAAGEPETSEVAEETAVDEV